MILGIQISATATLTTSYVGRPCPEESITFTCTVPGVEVFWEPPGVSRITITPSSTESVIEGLYTATLLSSNATSITSTLLTTARDGVTVECLTVGSVTIQVAGIYSDSVLAIVMYGSELCSCLFMFVGD